MIKTIKCENCGANMSMDTENTMRFCPFCGNAIKIPENYVDLEKFKAKHTEEVRQRIVKEKLEERKRDNKSTIITAICIVILIITCGFLIVQVDPDSKCERIVELIQQLIEKEDYDKALLEAQKIRVEKQGLFDSRFDRWENQRKDLIELIEQKKKESGK